MTSGGSRKHGFSPNVAGALSYLGGALTGALFLVLEKEDRFVRFHAMQSTITFALVLVAYFALSGLPLVGFVLRVTFRIGVALLWFWLMYQAFNGHRYKLPYIGDFAEHLL